MSCTPRFLSDENEKLIMEVICNESEGKAECCGKPLRELMPNVSEGAAEKHLPVIEQDGNKITVKVGSIYHPMSEEHSIAWVYLQTKKGSQRVCLSHDKEPVAVFFIAEDDMPIAAYAYCNLHGFWKTEA